MNIRKATLEDLSQLTTLFEAYRAFYQKKADKEAATHFLTSRIQAGDSMIFVCETINEPKKLQGFVQLYPLFSSTRMQKMWLLNDLFVDVNARGKGISHALIQAAKQYCKETFACGLLLETAKTNSIGNALYVKTDFVLQSEVNFYFWENPEDFLQ